MIGLAFLFILTVAMFLYFRQKMSYYEVRLSLLSDTVQTMAGITRSSLNESDSESECESESEKSIEYEPKIINLSHSIDPVTIDPVTIDLTEEPELPDVVPNIELITEDLTVVSDDETKKIDLPTEFDNFTVKELKEKVAELNGPKLKTKKDLIQYLQNKI